MENIQICEIKGGKNKDYPHILSRDGKYIFSCSDRLDAYHSGAKIFYVCKYLSRAFFTEVMGEEIYTKYNFHLDEWVFEYEEHEYIARKDDVLQVMYVMSERSIPPDWAWRRPIGNSNGYPIWNTQIDHPQLRLEKVRDLQLIFKKGPAFELLEYCSKALLELPEIMVPNAKALHTSLGGMPLTLYGKPRDVIIAQRTPLQNLMEEVKDKYRQILMAVKTKPFVLLAGISGIGKSSLVRTLAYKTCNEKELQYSDRPGNFELIKVKPDWYDSSELIGYTTQKGGMIRYNITAFIRFIIKAWRYKQVPFWLCLDEMNLARVEQYFAEFLSIIETRRFHEEQMYSDAFISREDILLYSNEDPSFWLNLGLENEVALQQQFLSLGITMPPNLIVMGTVNMDETTHSFSRKVLDRAMTIEMNKVDLNKGLGLPENDWEYPDVYISAEDLLGQPQDVNMVYNDNPDIGRKVIKELEEINEALINSPFMFAYRVRDEMLIYCTYNASLQPPNITSKKWLFTCLDEMIMMKILSRIEGNEKKCGSIINGLLEKIGTKFPESHKKLLQMQFRLNNNGYTSFWN
ncbi:hypothetical protein GO495_07700 [Chitinophaga oryziterrae]|uniref:ATPase dynein-related AAA domain-containing protein n=1 Tax=Chitinophaga oryziterrae TaxID=1031224 RepID=A0A6N8J8L6_9BACT|nr:AAA family ATPase [Chitinophaga oryziterrae]MVT40462.1 hypothetical protein [Chitinophaga oryziterrae]